MYSSPGDPETIECLLRRETRLRPVSSDAGSAFTIAAWTREGAGAASWALTPHLPSHPFPPFLGQFTRKGEGEEQRGTPAPSDSGRARSNLAGACLAALECDNRNRQQLCLGEWFAEAAGVLVQLEGSAQPSLPLCGTGVIVLHHPTRAVHCELVPCSGLTNGGPVAALCTPSGLSSLFSTLLSWGATFAAMLYAHEGLAELSSW